MNRIKKFFAMVLCLVALMTPIDDRPDLRPRRARLRTYARRAFYSYQRIVNRRWAHLKTETHGMLRPATYKAIYQAAKRMADLDFVEIGGAHGASSIAIAQGMADGGRTGRLVVVEQCRGGSRALYGGYDQNYATITRNYRRFGVADRISLYPYKLLDETVPDVLGLLETKSIAGFMHDADGDLGRDFQHFWPLVIPGGLIVIDDYPRSEHVTHPKKYRTWFLLNQLMEWGLFAIDERHTDTVIGHKPLVAPGWDLFDRAVMDQIKDEHALAVAA